MEKLLDKYAELIVRTGVNLQKGEEVYLSSDLVAAPLARAVAKEAYKQGAKHVNVMWIDDEISRTKYLNEDEQTVADIPAWKVLQTEEIVDRKAVLVHIVSDNPMVFQGVSAKIMSAAQKASSEKCKKYRDSTMSGNTRWTIAAYPNETWAKIAFPKLSGEEAVKKLGDMIAKAVRLDEIDPIRAWQEHQSKLTKRVGILNSAGIKSLRYKNSIGTDLYIELPQNYVFEGGASEGGGGVMYVANMPTEEVFTAPLKGSANGRVVASMPLIYNGNEIDGFWMEFKDGAVVNYHADKGMEFLKELIETDEGSRYLGEVALVGYNSPIQNLKTLFYSTLFDENASCHFALGRAYPSCVKGGDKMSVEQQKQAGLNYSFEHCDFMVGTPDLSIIAETCDGKTMIVFEGGDWKF